MMKQWQMPGDLQSGDTLRKQGCIEEIYEQDKGRKRKAGK